MVELCQQAPKSVFNYIHFKCYEQQKSKGKNSKTQKTERNVTYYKCLTSWKQRIGLFSSTIVRVESVEKIRNRLSEMMKSQAKSSLDGSRAATFGSFASLAAESDDAILKKDASLFDKGLEAIVSPYVRIFSSFINTGRKFLLAHNQFISIFNLTKEKWTKKHHRFENTVQ